MKTFFITILICFSLFSNSQTSIFENLNTKNYGTFNLNAQYFFIHRSRFTKEIDTNTITDYHKHDNSGSIAFTFNYKSPEFNGLSLKLSYLQALQFHEYKEFIDNSNPDVVPSNFGAKTVQNPSFGFLNNFSLNYALNALGLKGGYLSVGRMPLDMEYMTLYPIRQKAQAYEGIYINIPNIKRWNFKLGHITRFSSWIPNPDIGFSEVKLSYRNDTNGVFTHSNGQTFAEASYNNKIKKQFLALYYVKFHSLLDVMGFSYLQQIIPLDLDTAFSLRGKGTYQSGEMGSTNAIQLGLLFTHNTFNLEGGLFSVNGDMEIQNPFAAKWIISEPLFEIDFQREAGSKSYYIESSYKIGNGKINTLYLRTDNAQLNQVSEEYNIITSHKISKRLNGAIKLAFFRTETPLGIQQLSDARLVVKYSF